MKKYRLRKWVKVTIAIILYSLLAIALYQLFTKETTKTTPVGSYTCKGGIIKICSGSNEVADYLGV